MIRNATISKFKLTDAKRVTFEIDFFIELYSWLEAHSGLSRTYITPAFRNMISFSRDTGSNPPKADDL